MNEHNLTDQEIGNAVSLHIALKASGVTLSDILILQSLVQEEMDSLGAELALDALEEWVVDQENLKCG